jgi:hypothetical protein
MGTPANHSEDDALVSKILQRSATDRQFRTRLLNDPDGAVEEVIGVSVSTLPNAPKVKFIEKDAGVDALVVLPDFMDPDGVLSDAELEAVAGGDWCITSCGWTITVCENTSNNKLCSSS